MSYATLAQLRLYLPQVADLGMQSIVVTGDPTAGTFTLGYEGTSAAPLAYNATATAVQTALRAIAAIGSNVKVTGAPGSYVAAFQGTLATDAGPITLDFNGLTGGTAPTVAIDPHADAVLQLCLDNATDTVRRAMRALLDDPAFDYAAYGAASDKIVSGYYGSYLRLPAYQLGSVATVSYQSGANPSSYTALLASEWEETGDGRLYRAGGWANTRYQVNAIWGYGPDAPPAIQQVTLELAVNIWRSRDKGGWTDTIGVDGSGAVQVSGLTNLQRQILLAERDQLIVIGV